MDYIIILVLLLSLFAAVAVFKITKAIIKAVMAGMAILFIFSIIFGYFLLADINDIKDNFNTKSNLFLLEKDQKIIAGFTTTPASEEEGKPIPLSSSMLAEIQEGYTDKDYSLALGENYKMFAINIVSFENITLLIPQNTITESQLYALLESDSPITDYIDMKSPAGTTAQQKEILRKQLLESSEFSDDAGFKSSLFNVLVSSALQEKTPLFLFEEHQKGNIMVYPETIAFQTLKLLPVSVLSNLVIKPGEE